MKNISQIIFITLLAKNICLSQDSNKLIIIENADELIGNNINNSQKLVGNVVIIKDDVRIECDTAYIDNAKKGISAHSNVNVNQADTLTISSNYMKYDNDTKILTAIGDVKLKEKTRVLKTEKLIFKRKEQEVYYRKNGTLIDSLNTLTSKRGLYILNEKKFIFNDSVNLENPKYKLKSDKLIYFKDTKIANSYGNTRILSNKNKIFCENAQYNPNKNLSILKTNATIFYKNKILKGDSLIYNSKKKHGIASKNVKLIDTTNKLIVISQYGEYFEVKDSAIITQNPIAIRVMNSLKKDSIMIKSDSMIIKGQKSPKIKGFRNVKIWKNDTKGICDTLKYNFSTNKIKMITKPILWFSKYQLNSDSIHIIVDTITKSIDSLSMINRAFIISKIDSNKFNQTKGRNIFGKFKNQELDKLYVRGSSISIYYILNNKKRVMAMNKVMCNDIDIYFKDRAINKIKFLTNPKATVFPISKLKKKDSKVQGFKWEEKKMPQREEFNITH